MAGPLGGGCAGLGGRGATPQGPHRPQPRVARQERASTESLLECVLESFAFLHADLGARRLALLGGSPGPR